MTTVAVRTQQPAVRPYCSGNDCRIDPWQFKLCCHGCPNEDKDGGCPERCPSVGRCSKARPAA